AGASGTVAIDRAVGGRALATVTFGPASVVSNPDYVQQLSWQGHTKSSVSMLRRVGPGVYRTVTPLPLSGSWKSLIRMQQGRVRGDVPVYLPADPAIPVAGIPARSTVTRAVISDTTLMQRERKRNVAGWLWSTATSLVLAIIAVLLAIIGWGLNRVAGAITDDSPPDRRGAAVGQRRWRRRARSGVVAAGAGR
ncbi:MAG TPA: hypothetical protein VIM18_05700, partial [Solirubrobacteraceae bacterium]